MGDQGGRATAFQRIDMFNDDRTEQVWELFRDELRLAAVLGGQDQETRPRVPQAYCDLWADGSDGGIRERPADKSENDF